MKLYIVTNTGTDETIVVEAHSEQEAVRKTGWWPQDCSAREKREQPKPKSEKRER